MPGLRGLAFAALLAGGLAFTGQTSLPGGVIQTDGYAAPPLILADLDGQAFDLTELRGRWAFVHFWASWCGPCRKEMPAIQRMSDTLGDSALAIVLVNTAETEDAVFSFLGIVAPALTTLMDRDGLVTEQWQPRGLPASFLVDPGGRVRYLALGGRPWDEDTYLDFLRALPGE